MLAYRRLTAFVICALSAFAVIPAVSAAAAKAGTELTPGWSILEGTVTCPGQQPRHLSSNHAAAFMQSWYLATLYGTVTKVRRPSASLPVCTFKVPDVINGQPYRFVSWYVEASDGKK